MGLQDRHSKRQPSSSIMMRILGSSYPERKVVATITPDCWGARPLSAGDEEVGCCRAVLGMFFLFGWFLGLSLGLPRVDLGAL